MDPWGFIHITPEAGGSLNSSEWSLCRWRVPMLEKGMHDMKSKSEDEQPGFAIDKLHPFVMQSLF